MSSNKKILCVISVTVVILIIFLYTFKTNSVEKFIKEEYAVNAKIIEKVKNTKDDYTYILYDNKRKFKFNCRLYKEIFNLDNASFFKFNDKSCNYYEMLTKNLRNKINEIEDKYNVIFNNNTNGLINQVIISNDEITDEDITNVTNAVNELVKLYDLEVEVKDDIYILLNNKSYTDYYFKYTINGDKVILHDSNDEFYKRYNISKSMEKDLLKYVNDKYDVKCYIKDLSVIPIDTNEASYVFVDDIKKFRINIHINYEKYNDDIKNLKQIERYITEIIEEVY